VSLTTTKKTKKMKTTKKTKKQSRIDEVRPFTRKKKFIESYVETPMSLEELRELLWCDINHIKVDGCSTFIEGLEGFTHYSEVDGVKTPVRKTGIARGRYIIILPRGLKNYPGRSLTYISWVGYKGSDFLEFEFLVNAENSLALMLGECPPLTQ
jgi:hypothetical protein